VPAAGTTGNPENTSIAGLLAYSINLPLAGSCRKPALQLDSREIIGARLVSAEALDDIPVTGPVRAYIARWLPLHVLQT
jgi:hypothetical protein